MLFVSFGDGRFACSVIVSPSLFLAMCLSEKNERKTCRVDIHLLRFLTDILVHRRLNFERDADRRQQPARRSVAVF